MNWKPLLIIIAILLVGTGAAEAQCVVDTSTPTYDNGKFLRYTPCNENGALKTTGAGGGSGDGTINDGVSSSIKATVKDYTNSNPLAVIPVDTNGDPASLTVCNPKDTLQAPISTASSGNVELVALTSGQTIYVCDWTLVATGAVAVQIIYGTGTACGTGETNMTGAMPLAANGGWTHNYDGRLKTAEANALCIELSGAVQVDGVVTYRKAATF